MGKKVKFGGDPEVFLEIGGKSMPAHLYFARQDNPTKLSITWPGIVAFRDGYAVELNLPPQDNIQWINYDFKLAIKGIVERTKCNVIAAATFPIDDLDDKAKWPQDVLISGCTPSINAYTGRKQIVAPPGSITPEVLGDATLTELDLAEHPNRYGGGHIHFSTYGGDRDEWFRCPNMTIKLLDREVGIKITDDFNAPGEFTRRKYYGRAGEYRLGGEKGDGEYKDGFFGLEYRVPSNGIWTHPSKFRAALTKIQWVIDNFSKLADKWDSAEETGVQNAINTDAPLLRRYFTSAYAEAA